jgi:excisionase family DNA binding protein
MKTRMEPGTMSELLTVEDVAARLKMNRITVYGYIKNRELPSIRLGKRTLRVSEADLVRFLSERGNV